MITQLVSDISLYRLQNLLSTFLTGLRFEKGLDLGCGDGVLTKHFKYCCDHILAVDKDKNKIREAEANDHYDQIEFRMMDLDKEFTEGKFELVTTEGKFDLVIMGSIFSYVKSPEGLVDRVYECLEDKGYVVAYENMVPIKVLDEDKRFEKIIDCRLTRENRGGWTLGLWRKI